MANDSKAMGPVHVHKSDFSPGKRYTRISAGVLNDVELMTESPLAYAMLVHLLGKRPDWVINTRYFVNMKLAGHNQVNAAFRVLRERGYLTLDVKRERGRIVKATYDLYEEPQRAGAGAVELADDQLGSTVDKEKTAGQPRPPERVSGAQPAPQGGLPMEAECAGQDHNPVSGHIATTEGPKVPKSEVIKTGSGQPKRREGLKFVMQPSRGSRTTGSTGPGGGAAPSPGGRTATDRRRSIVRRPEGWVHPLALEAPPGPLRDRYMARMADVTHIYITTGEPILEEDRPYAT